MYTYTNRGCQKLYKHDTVLSLTPLQKCNYTSAEAEHTEITLLCYYKYRNCKSI